MKCPKCETENPETSRFCTNCGTQLIPVEADSLSGQLTEDIHVMPTKTIEAPIEELTTGSIFADRYKIVTELGRGGMGKVYRAIDQKIDEEIAHLTSGRLWWGDIYAKSFYMLGKIAEQRGWPGKAIEHYEKFLDVWKDADPGLPEIEDAKKRLAGL